MPTLITIPNGRSQSKEQLMPVDILLVEDSPTDILLARESLGNSKILHNLHIVSDGVEAMAFLEAKDKFQHSPRPTLIILDLNMPKMDGREVLAKIKNDEKFKRIPVVVLTTSKNVDDIKNAYGLHANCYIVKPMNYDQFEEVVKTIEIFWFAVVTLAEVE